MMELLRPSIKTVLLRGESNFIFHYGSMFCMVFGLTLLSTVFLNLKAEVGAQPTENGPLAAPYLSVFVTRSQPIGRSYSYLEDSIPSLTVGAGTGGGLKLGAYFRPLDYGLGFELESFAHNGRLSAPQTSVGGVTRFANQDFTQVNVLGNLLFRYRSDFIQPYIGGGVGFSAVFTEGQAQSGRGTQSGSHGLTGFATQAIAGARIMVTQHFFLFTEYKFLLSYTNADHCGGEEQNRADPCRVLNQLSYQSHYASVGLGFSF